MRGEGASTLFVVKAVLCPQKRLHIMRSEGTQPQSRFKQIMSFSQKQKGETANDLICRPKQINSNFI